MTDTPVPSAEAEIRAGTRFRFGQNWQSFARLLDESRIREAEDSLAEALETRALDGLRFLDIGSGSGLFSLAARRLGARVHSFDFDPQSVACTRALRERFCAGTPDWTVEQGSALDAAYLRSLGSFDIVYSWGVLHHTGQLWAALENAAIPVGPGGALFIALYNDQGGRSRFWAAVKRIHCSGLAGRAAMTAVFYPYFFGRALLKSLVKGENAFSAYRQGRGMSLVHDWQDWLGGHPFEVASVEAVVRFYRGRGFGLAHVRTTNGWGNNEFVFRRSGA